MYTHVDLCCGLGGWQAPFKESSEWRSIGIDVNRDLSPDIVGDIQQLPIRPDMDVTLVTASPPCTEFSKWDSPFYTDINPSMHLVDACLEAIDELQPTYWILENVRGLHLYWKPAEKLRNPWYFWGDYPMFDFEPQNKGMHWDSNNYGTYDPNAKRGNDAAEIPYHIADSLRRSIEWSL